MLTLYVHVYLILAGVIVNLADPVGLTPALSILASKGVNIMSYGQIPGGAQAAMNAGSSLHIGMYHMYQSYLCTYDKCKSV